MSRIRLPLLSALTGLLLLPLAAQAGITVSGKPKVSFFAVGSPGFLDIEGVSSSITGVEEGGKVTFTVPMATVKTGIDMRDDHMNEEFVKVAEFPNAVLSFDRSAVTWPETTGQRQTGTVQGEFTIHGVSQPVTVNYTNARSKTGWRVTAKYEFDCTHHGIAIPSYLGVTVDPKMRVEVTLDLVDG